MAKVLNNKNYLEEELKVKEEELRKSNKAQFIMIFLYLSVFFLVGNYFGENGYYSLLPVLPFANYFFVYLIYLVFLKHKYPIKKNIKKEYRILKAGLEGEEKSLLLFKQLPDSYTVITDLEIVHEDKRSQIDTIVIGNNGIFIIEVKNIKGEVTGEASDKNLKIIKTGRKGGRYEREIYNPIKQVNTHTYTLSRYLKSNNINSYINSCVLLINNESKCTVRNVEKTPIFTTTKEDFRKLSQWISVNNNTITDNEKMKIEGLLMKCIR